MWFRFPVGSNRINVAQQSFEMEVTDKDGREYFRAPDSLAATILDLPGFSSVIPETNIDDLPPDNPEQNSVIARLAAQVDALAQENAQLRELNSIAAENLKIEQEKSLRLENAVKELEKKRVESESQLAGPENAKSNAKTDENPVSKK